MIRTKHRRRLEADVSTKLMSAGGTAHNGHIHLENQEVYREEILRTQTGRLQMSMEHMVGRNSTEIIIISMVYYSISIIESFIESMHAITAR